MDNRLYYPKDIVQPLIYNQTEYIGYGVHRITGDIYSNKRYGIWTRMSTNVSGKSPYPKFVACMSGTRTSIPAHIAICETLFPLPNPPGVTKSEWKVTPNTVKRLMRKIWQVNHKDHVHSNYRPTNLEWVTGHENCSLYQEHRKKVVR